MFSLSMTFIIFAINTGTCSQWVESHVFLALETDKEFKRGQETTYINGKIYARPVNTFVSKKTIMHLKIS